MPLSVEARGPSARIKDDSKDNDAFVAPSFEPRKSARSESELVVVCAAFVLDVEEEHPHHESLDRGLPFRRR